jgi:hypothetical protein
VYPQLGRGLSPFSLRHLSQAPEEHSGNREEDQAEDLADGPAETRANRRARGGNGEQRRGLVRVDLECGKKSPASAPQTIMGVLRVLLVSVAPRAASRSACFPDS